MSCFPMGFFHSHSSATAVNWVLGTEFRRYLMNEVEQSILAQHAHSGKLRWSTSSGARTSQPWSCCCNPTDATPKRLKCNFFIETWKFWTMDITDLTPMKYPAYFKKYKTLPWIGTQLHCEANGCFPMGNFWSLINKRCVKKNDSHWCVASLCTVCCSKSSHISSWKTFLITHTSASTSSVI